MGEPLVGGSVGEGVVVLDVSVTRVGVGGVVAVLGAGSVDAEQVDGELVALLEGAADGVVTGEDGVGDEGCGAGGWGLALEESRGARRGGR